MNKLESDVAYFISASLPARYSVTGYNRIGKWEFLGAANIEFPPPSSFLIVNAARKIKRSKNKPTYGNATLILDGRVGKVLFKRFSEILKGAANSSNHHSIAVRYPDGEKHFIDVLVTNQIRKRRRGHIELRAEITICRAPVIQGSHDRP